MFKSETTEVLTDHCLVFLAVKRLIKPSFDHQLDNLLIHLKVNVQVYYHSASPTLVYCIHIRPCSNKKFKNSKRRSLLSCVMQRCHSVNVLMVNVDTCLQNLLNDFCVSLSGRRIDQILLQYVLAVDGLFEIDVIGLVKLVQTVLVVERLSQRCPIDLVV